MNKRGELTSTQIVSIVLVIIGTVIILFFLAFLFDDSSEDDREICRISVLTRATAPDIVGGAIPLKCRTDKICITSDSGFLGLGKGKCIQFAGEEHQKLSVSGNSLTSHREIEEILAKQMYKTTRIISSCSYRIFRFQ
mgnify:CR=1 FL=1